jgi:hypothetical protein
MTDLRKPLDQKNAQSLSRRKVVRDLLEGTRSATETAKIAIENSRRHLELDLDSWPAADRIRESF